ncbi:MAG: HAD family phosphatase [Dorea sp.]|jgi:Cof subfamily protein (haloacid dehalogenase superfamily)|nr:HAD family phosphatase [Dorea sp.]
MKYDVRMIGFDLDGTLLTTQKEFSEYTKQVLSRAVEKNIEILPVTGRPLCGLPEELTGFAGIRYAITANGARIMDLSQGITLRERLVPVPVAEKILHIFERYDTLREIYYDGVGYAQRESLERIGHFFPSAPMAGYVTSTRLPVEDLRKKFREENRAVDKLQGVFADVREREKALEELKSVAGIEATGSLSNNIEVNISGVNKGEALLWLGERLGIPAEETMAFGDGGNDMALMRYKGISVAMINGREDIKAAADHVTEESNDADGMARFLERHVL